MPSILVSNDDGVLSEGIGALAEALKKVGKVTVVAPSQERSTTGHSLTLHKPIRVSKIKSSVYSITGTPADCAYLSVKKLLKQKPDLLVSGINRGANLGNDIHYSGTVAAAREATFLKIPAIAISLDVLEEENNIDYTVAAHYAAQMAQWVLKRGLPEGVLLNVNVPNLPMSAIKGIRVIQTGFRYYSDRIVEQKDSRGRVYYWLGGNYLGYDKKGESDCKAVEAQYVSVTPLHIDATHHSTLKELQSWDLEGIHETVKKSV